jgi:hypothetical protein
MHVSSSLYPLQSHLPLPFFISLSIRVTYNNTIFCYMQSSLRLRDVHIWLLGLLYHVHLASTHPSINQPFTIPFPITPQGPTQSWVLRASRTICNSTRSPSPPSYIKAGGDARRNSTHIQYTISTQHTPFLLPLISYLGNYLVPIILSSRWELVTSLFFACEVRSACVLGQRVACDGRVLGFVYVWGVSEHVVFCERDWIGWASRWG